MASLKSVDNIPGVDLYDYRDTLYFSKYDYRLRMHVPGARYTWYCKRPSDIDRKLNGTFGRWGDIRKDDVQTVLDNLPALKTIVEVTIERKKNKNFSMRLEGNTLAIFSNDLDFLTKLQDRIGTKYRLDCSMAQTSGYSGIKYFVNEPSHKYRVYLRSKRVEDTFHTELRGTLSRTKTLYPSNALRRWVNNDSKRYGIWYFRWTSSAHFIDYDDESTLSYLALIHGEILGKKYKLEKRPDNI